MKRVCTLIGSAFGVLGLATVPAIAQTTHTVELLGNNKFAPRDVTIAVGDTIHWVWINGLHNVESGVIVSGSGVHDNIFRSGDPTSTADTEYDLIFDQAFLDANPIANNLYDYFCVVHAFVDMAGTITVQVSDCTTNADCDDSSVCNGAETCTSGSCVAGTALNCDDSNACTTDTCDATSGCLNVNNTLPCDDGNACTDNDTCAGGNCIGAPNSTCCQSNADCDDAEPCTTDSCAENLCTNAPIQNCLPCTADADCNDNNDCTDDQCVSAFCQFNANAATCDDGNACTANDTCASGNCAGTAIADCCQVDADCNDADACTLDTCAGGTCSNAAIANCTGGGGTTTTSPCGAMGMLTLGGLFFGVATLRLRRKHSA